MSVGKIGAFDGAKDNWDLYVDRLEQYFIVNDVKPVVKVPTLITVMGGEAYELMVNLCTPVKPCKKTFEELVTVMKDHLLPKPSILAERFKFRRRMQRQDESIADYVTALKKLTKHCRFASEYVKENLRDQFVCGLSSEYIRQRLFTEDDITFDKAYKLAVAMEAAEADAAMVQARTGDRHGAETGQARQESEGIKIYKMANESKARSYSDGRGRPHDASFVRGPSGIRAGSGKVRTDDVRKFRGSTSRTQGECTVCGRGHPSSSCKYKTYVCRVCTRRGHLRAMCPNLRQETAVHSLKHEEVVYSNSSDESSDEVTNFSMESKQFLKFGPYVLDVYINNVQLSMEIDTGCAISCISTSCYKRFFSEYKLKSSDITLRYYTGEMVKPVGKLSVLVTYKQISKLLDLYIVNSGKTSLLGRQWISELDIRYPDCNKTVANCNKLSDNPYVFNFESFSSRYSEVFSDGLGRYTGGPVTFHLRAEAKPVYLRARPLAYALREPVEEALRSLVRDGVITPVSSSDWATPIVPVMKKDGNIRICGDFKLTLNKCLEVDRFPLPRPEDLLAKLYGGEKFTKIDLSQAYAQFELDNNSKKFTVINTHKGLFMYNRLIYGLSSSPGIFQRKLEQLFGDMPRVGVFLDDLIITGVDDSSHLETLHEVFNRLRKCGLKIKKEKCSFFSDSVTYLGFVISKAGVQTCPDKVKAVEKVPVPKNISELRSFLGMVMYYAKFVPNISKILSPLYNLLKKGVTFEWTNECDMSFNKVKRMLTSNIILAHYTLDLPVVLTTDASAVGVGAVVSHLMPDGGERPVAFASRVLNTAERSYSQIEREALAIIYGVKKFHQYLYGRQFILRTDHKPLVTIFGSKTGIPVMAASRMQRWAVILAGYNYRIEYVRSEQNAADALSRLPVGKGKTEASEMTYINFIQNFLPITREVVRSHISKDEVLRKVFTYIHGGWPNQCKEEKLNSYFVRRNEMYIDMGCIAWGYRLVIPSTLREQLLKELHANHMGMVKMKAIARSYFWWPGIDTDIENIARGCTTCAEVGPAPDRVAPQPWPYASTPWTRIHVDFLGPFHGKTFLVLIDSTSKWLEIFQMQRTTAGAVIKVLRETFARFGLPREVVSDNGPPFSSSEYGNFMRNNGIKLTFTAVYHPASNGAAEGAVKLCKTAIKKAMRDGSDLDAALQSYLLAYRNVEHSTTGAAPAILLQKRNLRSRLDCLRGLTQVEDQVREKQSKQIVSTGGSQRVFKVGDTVWARAYTGGKKWEKGRVEEELGSRHYIVVGENGSPCKRHVDQLKNRWLNTYDPEVTNVGSPSTSNPVSLASTAQHPSSDSSPSRGLVRPAQLNSETKVEESTVPPVHDPRAGLRPRHLMKPVQRYGFEAD